MCTVSIVPHADGLRVISNRDERRDRAVALEPRVASCGSRAVTMPIDPAGGGSWVGVNDAGLVAALLNNAPLRALAAPCASGTGAEGYTSRGAIVPLALRSGSIASALASVRTLGAARFQPFRLVLVQRNEIALVTGARRILTVAAALLEGPCMFTASSLGDFLVETPRRRLFEWLMNDPDARLQGQALFHRHQWADKRDISVLMERGDAITVSRTTIDVASRGIALEYESLFPLRSPARLEIPAC